jgi:hypothetical protein
MQKQSAKGNIWTREEITEIRRKFHNKGFNYFHSCKNIIRIIESKKMRRMEHTGHMRGIQKFLSEHCEGVNSVGRQRRV